MDIGLFAAPDGVEATEKLFVDAEADGIDCVWLLQSFGADALVMMAALGRRTSRIRFGTAVVPTYPRHPMVLAQQALTTNLLLDGRLVLGVGPSHRVRVEKAWGLSYEKPYSHTREYLTALEGALTQHVQYRGQLVSADGDLDVPGAPAPKVLLAGLGPKMLRLAGSHASGTITWMTGPRTLADSLVPGVRQAAEEAGRPAPEIIVPIPTCLTDAPTRARETAERNLAWYGTLPSYQAALAREGLVTPGQIALIGGPEQVLDGIGRFSEVGATTFAAQIFGDEDDRLATRELLGGIARSGIR
jgi:5,10-methylenetetrahydromethanopterin reductase